MKKDFTNSPVFEMLTTPEAEAVEKRPAPATDPAPKKKTARTFEPTRKELKSKKLLVLLKPTVYERVHAKAQEYDLSTNELINQIIEASV